jgi:hypothetical protein
MEHATFNFSVATQEGVVTTRDALYRIVCTTHDLTLDAWNESIIIGRNLDYGSYSG